MIALVCGGRDYDDRVMVDETLSTIGPRLVIHGGATGADALAGKWAARTGVCCIAMPAPWRGMGPKAGPVRNRWMLGVAMELRRARRTDLLVVAFPGGRGTANMVHRARMRQVEVMEVTP